jgi:hypothetical protein
MEELGRLRRLGRGREDRLLVIAEHFQPAAEIGGMVCPRDRGNLQPGAEKGGADLRNQFFEGIRLRAEPAGKVAIEALRAAGPVATMPISA